VSRYQLLPTSCSLNGTTLYKIMATYLYKCKVCGEEFEKKLHFNDEKGDITCSNGHHEVQRVYTPPHIIFKGPGFYINDSKSESTIKEEVSTRKGVS